MFEPIERHVGNYWQVARDRGRAALWRLRGAQLGAKARVGASCRVLRPWCLRTGDRLQLEPQVYLKITHDAAEVIFGHEVFIGYDAEIDISQKLILGNHVLIAPGCFITDHQHNYRRHTRIAAQGCRAAPVKLEDDVWLGAHAVVLPGITIGQGAIVGAGAVVTHDVLPWSIVAGVPARVIGHRT